MTTVFTGPHAETCQQFYMGWYIYLQEQLREWYQVFTPDLFQSPNFGREELIDALRSIALAAEGNGEPEEALEYINSILQSHPPQKLLSPEFLWMLVQAEVRATGDELVTPGQAAERSGQTFSAIINRIQRGTLTAYTDPTAKNPRRESRFIKLSDVME